MLSDAIIEDFENQEITEHTSPKRRIFCLHKLDCNSWLEVALTMKIAQIISCCTILVSLLISCSVAEDSTDTDSDTIEYGYENKRNSEGDFVIDDLEYEYEEVIGEDIPKNIIPFHKHPGVYVIDLEGILYALDSDNGEILWAKKVSDKLMKVTEAPPPPMNYGESGNGTFLQRMIILI